MSENNCRYPPPFLPPGRSKPSFAIMEPVCLPARASWAIIGSYLFGVPFAIWKQANRLEGIANPAIIEHIVLNVLDFRKLCFWAITVFWWVLQALRLFCIAIISRRGSWAALVVQNLQFINCIAFNAICPILPGSARHPVRYTNFQHRLGGIATTGRIEYIV